MSIYVETRVEGPLEELWEKTQDPSLHQRWDLRFTRIEYLPRPQGAPQRFLYATRIGFGLEIRGEGESVGSRDGSSGERTSALRFWSEDPRSLIREGSGYWKYLPDERGVRFFTGYDYKTRFGALGRAFDRLAFRPLIGWATAWSFDRLRLWIEKGLDPAVALERSLINAVARLALAFVFFYHGLVPKLVARHPDELALLAAGGVPEGAAPTVLALLGCAEIGLAAALVSARGRWVFALVAALMVAALAGVAATAPGYLAAAFNPVTLNLALVALAAVGWLASRDLPSAGRCLRRPPAEGT